MLYGCTACNGKVLYSVKSLIRPFESVTDLRLGAETLRRRRYGAIEVVDGRLCRVRLRPWPKILVGPELLWLGKWLHRWRGGDSLVLYYNHRGDFRTFWLWLTPFPREKRACGRSAWAWRRSMKLQD